MVALVLNVAPPGENWRVLNTDDFIPPADPGALTKGKISEIRQHIIP